MRRTLNAIAVLAILIALPAAAADNGFYLGGSAGQSAVDTGKIGNIQANGNATAFKVFAGFRVLTFLGVEGAYSDFGNVTRDPNPTTHNEAKITGYQLQAVGFIPLGIADIFGKAGMTQWKSDFTSTANGVPTTSSKDGTDPVYGVGAQFRIKSWAIRGEFEYFDVKNADKFYLYTIGASYTF